MAFTRKKKNSFITVIFIAVAVGIGAWQQELVMSTVGKAKEMFNKLTGN